MASKQVSMEDWTREVEKRLKGQTVSDLDSKHLSGLVAKVLYVSRPESSYQIVKKMGWIDIPIAGYASLGVASNPNQPFVASSQEIGLLRVDTVESSEYKGRVAPLNWNGEQIKSGIVHIDPWAFQLRQGPQPSVDSLQALSKQSGDRPITIDTTALVLQGATPVDELIWVLSTVTEWHQLGLLTSMNDVWIQISLDALLFENVAKCRALRRLLEQWCHQIGVDGSPFIHGETTLRMFTLIDPNVNLLRTTVAAIGGIWGGVDGLSIHPYDVLQGSTKHSRRIATNIHRVLSEESGLGQWMDPLEGSFAVEQWTEDLCEMAWKKFAQDESKGGLQVVIDTGVWSERLAAGQTARMSAIQQGQVVMTGVNKFANAAERLEADWLLSCPETAFKRDSETLERLRMRLQQEHTPQVQILCLQPLSVVKRQVDMANQFMATMGWHTEVVFDLASISDAEVLCLCGVKGEHISDIQSVLEDGRCVVTVGTSPEVLLNVNALALKSSHPDIQVWSDILKRLQESQGEGK